MPLLFGCCLSAPVYEKFIFCENDYSEWRRCFTQDAALLLRLEILMGLLYYWGSKLQWSMVQLERVHASHGRLFFLQKHGVCWSMTFSMVMHVEASMEASRESKWKSRCTRTLGTEAQASCDGSTVTRAGDCDYDLTALPWTPWSWTVWLQY